MQQSRNGDAIARIVNSGDWSVLDDSTASGNSMAAIVSPLPAISAPSSLDVPPPASSAAQHAGPEVELERPPPGCAPDAIKLFVGSIPKSYTESQLLPFFETVGKVIDLVIVRDKVTRESKGSAFLWYATRAHAELAILQFNLRHVLPNPDGEHNRPLVLRRAKLRTQVQARQSPSNTSTQHMMQFARPVGNPYAGQPPAAAMAMPGVHSAVYSTAGPRSNALLLSDMMSRLQMHAGVTHGHQSPTGPMNGHNAFAQPSQGSQHSLASFNSSHPIEDVDVMMQALRSAQLGAAAGPAAAGAGAELHNASSAVSLDLTSQQLATVNEYMHSVQNISGAKLTVSVGAGPTLFRLTMSGADAQVETAKALLRTVIQGA